MQQPEAKFKKALVDGFGQAFPLGWCAYLRALGKDGVPDLRFVIPGSGTEALGGLSALGGMWIEAKAEEKPYSPAQRLQMRNLHTAGDRVLGLRCRGMEGRLQARKISAEYPHLGAEHGSALTFKWGDMQDLHFWRRLFYLSGAP